MAYFIEMYHSIISKLRGALSHRGFRRYFKNTGWLISERILRMVSGFFIGVWVARYLGPEKFGVLSFVMAFIGLLGPFSALGFSSIVTRDMAKGEKDLDTLVSTTVGFRFVGGLFILLIGTVYMCITKDQPIFTYIALILAGAALVRKSFEPIEFYFRAHVLAEKIATAKVLGISLAVAAKVTLILLKFDVIYFALVILLEAAVSALALVLFFRTQPHRVRLAAFSPTRGFALLKESWWLIFSGIFSTIYLKIDQIMIGELLDSNEVGQYSAAVKISTFVYFIPLAIKQSLLPALVNAKKKSEVLYTRRLRELFLLVVILSYIIMVPIVLLGEPLITLLFGEAYQSAGRVLRWHIISALFIFIAVPRNLWITNESFFHLKLIGTVSGGVINIALNILLLPHFGIIAAAWSTLISYAAATILSNLFFSRSRVIFLEQIKAILLVPAILTLRKGRHE